MIKAVPLSLKEASAYVDELHRHHNHAVGDKYRVGAEINGELVGVVQVGRPVSRYLDDGKTLEVLRLCSNGSKDVCSFLYSRAARIAKDRRGNPGRGCRRRHHAADDRSHQPRQGRQDPNRKLEKYD